jgi:hypothetical protein
MAIALGKLCHHPPPSRRPAPPTRSQPRRIGPAHGIRGGDEREVVAIDWAAFGQGEPWARRLQMRDAVTNGGNALPRDDKPDVTRFRSAAARRVQAHRARARMGLRCLTVRVSKDLVRRA